MKQNVTRIVAFLLAAVLLMAVGCNRSPDASGDSSTDPSNSTSGGTNGDGTQPTGGDSSTDGTDPSDTTGSDATNPPTTPTTVPTEPSSTSLDLVLDGVGKSTIVIAQDASEKVTAAAEDLQDYISRITGVTLPIGYDSKDRTSGNYILVGPSKYTQKCGVETPTGYPDNEKIVLKRVDNYLILLGNDDGAFTGTQFAVTAFLEKLGCGWFGTTDLWTVVPSLKNICIEQMDEVKTPKFTSRSTNIMNSYKQIGMRWYQGGEKVLTGHGLPLLVPQSMFSTHPEWFSEINGKRDNSARWWQYCYSNQEFAKYVGQKVIEYFDANPTLMVFPIIANDGWEDDWCTCSECLKYRSASKGEDATLMAVFANRVAKVVATKYPERRLQLLSYHSTYTAPKTSVQLEPNVEMMFCKETSMTRPITSDYFKKGYNSITHNTYTTSWKQNFTTYIDRLKPKTISVWVWYCVAADQTMWANIPWVQGQVAIDDQNWWKSQGARYVFYDQGPLMAYHETGNSFPLRWPLWYVASKGAWDASLSANDILSDACSKLFGKAGQAMLGYYNALAAASEQTQGESITWVPCDPSEMYTAAQIQKIDAAANAARAFKGQVSDTEWERIQITLNYWEAAKSQF